MSKNAPHRQMPTVKSQWASKTVLLIYNDLHFPALFIYNVAMVMRPSSPYQFPAGSFNWFCVIGILGDEHISSKTVRTDQLVDWKEQNLVGNVFTSSIQPENEKIEL